MENMPIIEAHCTACYDTADTESGTVDDVIDFVKNHQCKPRKTK